LRLGPTWPVYEEPRLEYVSMQAPAPSTIESAFQQTTTRWMFLTPRQLTLSWWTAFGEAAEAVPRPFWLYKDDEHTPLILGFPMRASAAWQALAGALGSLIDEEVRALVADASPPVAPTAAPALDRAALVQRLAAMVENALVNSHGRRYAEILWLAVSREVSSRIAASLRALSTSTPQLSDTASMDVRYGVAQRLADIAHRAEAEALARIRGWEGVEIRPETLRFGRFLREDLMPFAERRLTLDLSQLDAYVKVARGLDPARFRDAFYALAERLDRLLQRDPAFSNALGLLDPEAGKLSPEARALSPAVLDLLAAWNHPDAPRLEPDFTALLRETGQVVRRFEVIVALRDRIFPVTIEGTRATTRLRGQPAGLSSFTRPFDFAAPGVVDSAVRRFGLLYDLVEFTALLEALRRQGRAAEERALRFMAEFHRATDVIRQRHRLRFEKFLGDGAFYTARSAIAVAAAAADVRNTYENLRTKGFPFSRGLRLAVNVGTYHLLPLAGEETGTPHFEFFGHSLVELARLTTGKTTYEVDDIADFLIASGYDLHRVLEFLEPVRSAPPRADAMRDRPYGAYLAESGELVNLGVVVTEALLRDLERELGDVPLGVALHAGHVWVHAPLAASSTTGPAVLLRYMGTARLKGLEPTPIAELIAPPATALQVRPLPSGSSLVNALHEAAGALSDASPEPAAEAMPVPAALCIASVLENPQVRTWYLGLYDDARNVLANAFLVPLPTVELKDGEPFEVWLHRRRGELARLYHGLARHDTGTSVALADLRDRDGYFTCLLDAPHRSPR
jgi:hypothetical protein